MTIKDVMEAELKNIYAMEKQILDVLPDVSQKVDSKKVQKKSKKFEKKCSKGLDVAKKLLDELELNSTNTKDSVVEQMTKNILEISNNAKLDDKVKKMGILTSIRRLKAYRKSCYKNTRYCAKKAGLKKVAKQINKMY